MMLLYRNEYIDQTVNQLINMFSNILNYHNLTKNSTKPKYSDIPSKKEMFHMEPFERLSFLIQFLRRHLYFVKYRSQFRSIYSLYCLISNGYKGTSVGLWHHFGRILRQNLFPT